MTTINIFKDPLAEEIWKTTYKNHADKDIHDTWRRVATAIASAESTHELKDYWSEQFYEMMSDFKVVPGGRILVNAGAGWKGATYMNCYVGPLPDYDIDSIDAIYKVLADQANTLKSEGGWGMNFSWLRPRGSFIEGVGVESPGAVKFMELFDKSSEIVTSGSGKASKNSRAKGKIRKGAMMGILDVWHPDIIEFITAKQTPGRLTKFNVSVNCTDDFMEQLNDVQNIQDRIKDVQAMDESEFTSPTKQECLDNLDHALACGEYWALEYPDTTHPFYAAEWKGNLRDWKKKGYPVVTHHETTVTKIWDMIMKSTYTRNEPGVLFLDRANYYNPLNYGETILATNPCVTGETLILTDKGYFPIKDLVGKKVNVWNGTIWSEVEPRITGNWQDIMVLTFSDGTEIKCTPYHGFITKGNSKVEARHLAIGDKLKKFDLPVVHGDAVLDNAYSRGVYAGDGTRNTKEVFLYGIKKKLLPYLSVHTYSEHSSTGEDIRLCVTLGVENLCKTFVPSTNYTVSSRLDWLAGLLDTDGCVVEGCGQITSVDREFLLNTKLMLTTLGVQSNLAINKYAETAKLMPDGKGGQKEYNTQDCWRLNISASGMQDLIRLGLKTHRVVFEHVPNRQASRHITLVSSSYRQFKEENVYCFNEPINHTGIFNGILTGQCGEQTLSPGGVCDLGTINLTQFIRADRLGFDIPRITQYVKKLVRFLDNVNSLSEAPLPEYKDSMDHKRRVGCGVMGYGSSLYIMKVAYGSERAAAIRDELLQAFAKAAYEASIDLAEEKGMFTYCEPEKHVQAPFIQSLGLSQEYLDKLAKVGIRNSALLSNQPNGNSSLLCNIISGGIEPVFMAYFIRTKICPTIPDEIRDVTPNYPAGIFEETEFFKWHKEGDEQILRGVTAEGKVYKIDRSRGLTEEIPCIDYGVKQLMDAGEWDETAEWAKTTETLTVKDHVSELEGFARWVDSACSKTCNIPNDYPYEDFKDLYLDVYNTGIIKGFTTYRAGTMASVLSAKEEAKAEPEDEEIILDETKLPDSLPCTLKTLKAEGRKWYLTLVLDESQKRPVALFANTNSAEKNTTANDAVEKLRALAVTKGIPTEHIESVLRKVGNDSNTTKICRFISLNLRHGVLVKNVVHTLDEVDCLAGSFVFHIRKFLATWIKDGEKVTGQTCPECNSVDTIVYQEGCKICKNCGNSKCG